jgi:hypothetical protein
MKVTLNDLGVALQEPRPAEAEAVETSFRNKDLKELVRQVYPDVDSIRIGKQGVFLEIDKTRKPLVIHQFRFFFSMWICAIGMSALAIWAGMAYAKGASVSFVASIMTASLVLALLCRLIGGKISAHYESNVRNFLRDTRASGRTRKTMLDGCLRALWGLRYATPFLAKRKTLNPFLLQAKSVHIEDMVGDAVLSGFYTALTLSPSEAQRLDKQNLFDAALQNALDIWEKDFRSRWYQGVFTPWLLSGLVLSNGLILLLLYLIWSIPSPP